MPVKIECRCGKHFSVKPSRVKKQRHSLSCSRECGRTAKRKDTVEGFMARVDIQEHGCWEWIGVRMWLDYGTVRIDGKILRAHRVMWRLVNGDIPDNMMVCHKCDNPPCVRPDHLFLGTAKDNSDDCHSKGRGSRGEAVPQSKLTTEQVIEIKKLAKHYKHREIAARYGVSRAMISYIARGAWWKHITI